MEGGLQPMQSDSGPCSPNHSPALCWGVMVVPGQHLTPSFWDALVHPMAYVLTGLSLTMNHWSMDVPLNHWFMSSLTLEKSPGLFLSNNCEIQELIGSYLWPPQRMKGLCTRERKAAQRNGERPRILGPEPLVPDVPKAHQGPAMGSIISVPAPFWAETSLNGVSVADNLGSPN